MTPADRIVELIKERGLKQNYLANKVGLTPQNLNGKLKKNWKFSFDEIELICKVLKCKPNAILKAKKSKRE